ncbi:MAG TPA: class I SAM-dependent methyltransferase [Dehalococcoidia bacterium]
MPNPPNVLTLVPDEIERYAEQHTTPAPPLLDELFRTTRTEMASQASMLSGHLEGVFLQMLVAAVRAKRVLEIGTFTGGSALMMAAALPDDGELITCDVDPKTMAVARGYFDRSPHGHKIRQIAGPALKTMETLTGQFDFIFIDADKENYTGYYEAALPLLAPTGLIAIDNVLWSGRVLAPKEDSDRAIVAFNEHVQNDPRVINVLVSVRDGVMLVRKP